MWWMRCEGAKPSQYALGMAARKQQRELDRQLKAYRRETMELSPKLRLEGVAKGVTLETFPASVHPLEQPTEESGQMPTPSAEYKRLRRQTFSGESVWRESVWWHRVSGGKEQPRARGHRQCQFSRDGQSRARQSCVVSECAGG